MRSNCDMQTKNKDFHKLPSVASLSIWLPERS